MTNFELVFVYGTLKRGRCNNSLMEDSALESNNCTVSNAELYENCVFPMLVWSDCEESKVKGELWSVSPQVLERLDELEGHPYLYKRSKVNVRDGSGSCLAWVYVWQGPTNDVSLVQRKSKTEAFEW